MVYRRVGLFSTAAAAAVAKVTVKAAPKGTEICAFSSPDEASYPVCLSTFQEDLFVFLWDLSAILCACPYSWGTCLCSCGTCQLSRVPVHIPGGPVCVPVGPVSYPVCLSTFQEDLSVFLWDLSAILCACPYSWGTCLTVPVGPVSYPVCLSIFLGDLSDCSCGTCQLSCVPVHILGGPVCVPVYLSTFQEDLSMSSVLPTSNPVHLSVFQEDLSAVYREENIGLDLY
uniref:Uncharacterized protein n=1 Tax=Branchiostoma floridae TaxID=7739 RepID=C3YEA9_BRAFL|eukprot:XP_002605407.1 hypothetical protein BRAFLDRAFT_120651 [Branchiostoma floridae]